MGQAPQDAAASAPSLPTDDAAFDVAIVGCGPVGALAAALLAQAGLSVFVCDKLRGVYETPRAISLDHEVMRLFQQIGVADAVAPFVEPFTDSEYFGVDGQLIRRMTMVAPPYPQGCTPSMVFTQPAVERVLRAHVATLPNVEVALGTELRSFIADAEGVTLLLARDEGCEGRESRESRETQRRARWLIGCDGGSSTVRAAAGIELDDLDFDEPWLVVDVIVNDAGLARLPRTSVQYCEPERPCTLVIGPQRHRRWEISLKADEDPREAATPEGTWRLLSRWLRPDEGQLWRQASYRFHALVARRWRSGDEQQRGRLFLAGDAAHMQPPFLGQGMCQGLRDAANLAWKLAAVQRGEVRGAAAEALLDSYGAERGAHVRELTKRLQAIGAVICERDTARARERDARLLTECGGVVRDTPRQDVLPALSTGCLAAASGPGRGMLFPQPRLVGADASAGLAGEAGGVLMDKRFGASWRLVLDAAWPVAAALPLPSTITRIALGDADSRESEGVAAAWFTRQGVAAALVRPDHYVFGTAADAAQLAAVLAEWHAALGATPTAPFPAGQESKP